MPYQGKGYKKSTLPLCKVLDLLSLFDKILHYDIMHSGMALPETVGGYTLCPRKGVMRMQYVTYADLFSFAIVIIGIVGLFISILEHIKK